jgi:hypothetical protein
MLSSTVNLLSLVQQTTKEHNIYDQPALAPSGLVQAEAMGRIAAFFIRLRKLRIFSVTFTEPIAKS